MKYLSKAITVVFIISMVAATCCAGPMQDLQTSVGTDKLAHFGMSYLLDDQLKQHTKMTPLERVLVCTALAYYKEKTDTVFDKRDVSASVMGAVFCEVKIKFRF